MAPTTKRRKVLAERFPCHTCLEEKTTGQFPDYNPTKTCDHLINTCKRCLKEWVELRIETEVFTPHIPCPQCDEKMSRTDVEMVLTKKVFSRYVELERRYIAETTPGWRWCLVPHCRSGQVHVRQKSGSKDDPIDVDESNPSWSDRLRKNDKTATKTKNVAPKTKAKRKASEPDICTCKDCGAKACVPCDRPWHDGETCEEYQARIKDRVKEEDASLAAIQKQTKLCPQCSKSIEKNGGCRHMYCTQCGEEFCWDCMQLINRNNRWCGCGRTPGH